MSDALAALSVVDPSAIAAPFGPAITVDPESVDDARLPPDHPAWQRDVLSLSSRTRALLAHLAPVVVRTLSYWDHAVRSLGLGARTLSVDPAGCYRLR